MTYARAIRRQMLVSMNDGIAGPKRGSWSRSSFAKASEDTLFCLTLSGWPATRSPQGEGWWAYLGLNQGPLPCEGSALPLSYTPALARPCGPSIEVLGSFGSSFSEPCRPARQRGVGQAPEAVKTPGFRRSWVRSKQSRALLVPDKKRARRPHRMGKSFGKEKACLTWVPRAARVLGLPPLLPLKGTVFGASLRPNGAHSRRALYPQFVLSLEYRLLSSVYSSANSVIFY